jgi:glycerol-3-phosphate dehydrogenase (NAD(P)+)
VIAVAGAGAFGTALAVVLARAGHAVTLWARDPGPLEARRESLGLAGVRLPAGVAPTGDPAAAAEAEAILLAVPMQELGGFLASHRRLLDGRLLVACCKGMERATGAGPVEVMARECPAARPALISGPGFAADLAAGLPTAMTLGVAGDGGDLQALLSGEALRLYLSGDLAGIEIGGAVKNVIAIACGVAIGAGLGDSARAALMTRGFAEMLRFATARGADPRTLAGLSGLGDLVLTCGSEKSRNFRHGLAIGRGAVPAEETVEGVPTTFALAAQARALDIEMPVTQALARLLQGETDVAGAMRGLLSRPLKSE